MEQKLTTYAFIDANNLHLAIRDAGWKLDFKRFRIYLAEKYAVRKAYMFLGFLEEQKNLYQSLEKYGYILIFKPTLKDADGEVKGNCDAELVLHTMIEYLHYTKALIITGDGDFYCLVQYLLEKKKLAALIIPHQYKYSALLKFKIFRPYLRFMNDLKDKLAYKKEKAP